MGGRSDPHKRRRSARVWNAKQGASKRVEMGYEAKGRICQRRGSFIPNALPSNGAVPILKDRHFPRLESNFLLVQPDRHKSTLLAGMRALTTAPRVDCLGVMDAPWSMLSTSIENGRTFETMETDHENRLVQGGPFFSRERLYLLQHLG